MGGHHHHGHPPPRHDHHEHHHGGHGNPLMTLLCCPCMMFSSILTCLCSPFLRCFGWGEHGHHHRRY
ncbi:hypothetical protein DCAR_0626296 [Daucus carota subsp. sativus]|uniref:Uncharacterized protein n=1 Tax=Daucus carota subsp. sativus TaxID=79200 RepID=A0AAF0XGU1_DAUCS|nr:hypothetical protein DCAR_0626296 [Daucus carota subsp. sativus]